MHSMAAVCILMRRHEFYGGSMHSMAAVCILWRRCKHSKLHMLKGNEHGGYCNTLLKSVSAPAFKLYDFNTIGI